MNMPFFHVKPKHDPWRSSVWNRAGSNTALAKKKIFLKGNIYKPDKNESYIKT